MTQYLGWGVLHDPIFRLECIASPFYLGWGYSGGTIQCEYNAVGVQCSGVQCSGGIMHLGWEVQPYK
jgi:hypothetical protein